MSKDPWDTPTKEAFIRKESIRRHPLYRQEFETAFAIYRKNLHPNMMSHPDSDLIESFNLSNEAKELCERWKLAFTLHPEDKLWDVPSDSAPFFFADYETAVRVILYSKSKEIAIAPEKLFISDPGDKDKTLALSDSWSYLDKTAQLRESRYLCLEIDLFDTMGQIKEEVAELVNRYKDSIIDKEVQSYLRTHNESPPLPTGLSTEQWFTERQKQEKQKIDECRKQVEKDNKYRRRGKSLDISFYENLSGGPIDIFQIWDMHQKGESAWGITRSCILKLEANPLMIIMITMTKEQKDYYEE